MIWFVAGFVVAWLLVALIVLALCASAARGGPGVRGSRAAQDRDLMGLHDETFWWEAEERFYAAAAPEAATVEDPRQEGRDEYPRRTRPADYGFWTPARAREDEPA